MITFFTSSKVLLDWIEKEGFDSSSAKLINILGQEYSTLIQEALTSIFNSEKDEKESSVKSFFKIFTDIMNKGANMEKTAQSRDRNGYTRGSRNKWNCCVDNHDANTPWKIAKEKMTGFNHYRTDDIVFDNDPNHIYSGEAIWRMYVMDKFSSEYQDVKTGKWVGGYINDRFYVYPDGGSEHNTEAPRDGGNQLGLPPGVKTMQPRPHQYSTERRLEEARGNKTEAIVIESSNKKTIKLSSLPQERISNVSYNVLRDTLDMRENGFEYEEMLSHVSDHYDISVSSVAKIDKIAQKLKEKHNNVFYGLNKESQVNSLVSNSSFEVASPTEVLVDGQKKTLENNTFVVCINPENLEFQITEGSDTGTHFTLESIDDISNFIHLDEDEHNIQEASHELGLNESLESSEFTDLTDPNELNESYKAAKTIRKTKMAQSEVDIVCLISFIKKTPHLYGMFLSLATEADEESAANSIWENIIKTNSNLKNKFEIFCKKYK